MMISGSPATTSSPMTNSQKRNAQLNKKNCRDLSTGQNFETEDLRSFIKIILVSRLRNVGVAKPARRLLEVLTHRKWGKANCRDL